MSKEYEKFDEMTRDGEDVAVVLSVADWHRIQTSGRLSFKDVLLGPGPRFDIPLPKRGTGKSRKPPVFD